MYGAGRAFAEKLLIQFDPSLDEKTAHKKAMEMYNQTKGKRQKDSEKIGSFD